MRVTADDTQSDSGNPFAPPSDIIVVTTPYVPGYRITKVIGATFGLVVRSRGLGQNVGAFFRSWAGGEIKVYTNLLEKVRHQSIERLCENAKNLGANAVISVGFDTSEIGNATSEVMAYGTAVVVEKDLGKSQSVTLA